MMHSESKQGEKRRENEVSERLCQRRRRSYLAGLDRARVLRELVVGVGMTARRLRGRRMAGRAHDCGHWMDPLARCP